MHQIVRCPVDFVHGSAGRDSSREVLRAEVFVVPGAENDSGGIRASGGPEETQLT